VWYRSSPCADREEVGGSIVEVDLFDTSLIEPNTLIELRCSCGRISRTRPAWKLGSDYPQQTGAALDTVGPAESEREL
jgi:hypothetical protein